MHVDIHVLYFLRVFMVGSNDTTITRNCMTNKMQILVYLFVPNQFHMFRKMFLSIIRST